MSKFAAPAIATRSILTKLSLEGFVFDRFGALP